MLLVAQNGKVMYEWGATSSLYIKPLETKNGEIKYSLCIDDASNYEKVMAYYSSEARCMRELESFQLTYADTMEILTYFDHSAETTIPVPCTKHTIFRFSKETGKEEE